MAKKTFLSDREREFPAKYSDSLMLFLEEELEGYEKILDPFAGTGKIRAIRPDAYLLEIEPEWAEIRGATVGDALELPWPDSFFDAIVTSPTYGNRMADHHNAKDDSKRNTYRHTLGRELSPHNSGNLQWGVEYRKFYYAAWREARRVLRDGGRFVLNIKDHIRKGKVANVTHFHRLLLIIMGFDLVKEYRVMTPGLREGENHDVRIAHESILVFKKIEPEPMEFLVAEFDRLWPSLKDLPDGNDPFPHYPISGIENL